MWVGGQDLISSLSCCQPAGVSQATVDANDENYAVHILQRSNRFSSFNKTDGPWGNVFRPLANLHGISYDQ